MMRSESSIVGSPPKKRPANSGSILIDHGPLERIVVLDTVWVIAMPGNAGIVYDTIERTARDAWAKMADRKPFGTAQESNHVLRGRGYRARKVHVVLTLKE